MQNQLQLNGRIYNTQPLAPSSSDSPLLIALIDSDENTNFTVSAMAERENWDLAYFRDSLEALRRIPVIQPDVVIMDVSSSGVACVQTLRCLMPHVAIIILSNCADFHIIIISLMAGANGYLLKPEQTAPLKDAIFQVTNGAAALCGQAQVGLLACLHRAFAASSSKAYTERELQIMACLIQSHSDKEISTRLNISTNTVHVHLVRMFKKLNAHNRAEAIKNFFQLSLESTSSYCPPSRNTSS